MMPSNSGGSARDVLGRVRYVRCIWCHDVSTLVHIMRCDVRRILKFGCVRSLKGLKDNGAVLVRAAIKAALSLDESDVDGDCDPVRGGIEYQPTKSSISGVSHKDPDPCLATVQHLASSI